MVETCTVAIEKDGEHVKTVEVGAFNTSPEKLREGVPELLDMYLALSEASDELVSLGDFTLWLIAQCHEEVRVNGGLTR